MRPLVIIGGGAQGLWTRQIALAMGRSVKGYLDRVRVAGEDVHGFPVLGDYSLAYDREIIARNDIAIAVGNPRERVDMARRIKELGGVLPSLIHPLSIVSLSANIGQGVTINALSYVHEDSTLGDFTVVENHSSIGIACRLGIGVHVTTGCMLNGYCSVGDETMVGSGAIINPRVNVGRFCIVGAGAVVHRDVPDAKVVVGVPASPIKDVQISR